jgi:hypothetical protein
VHVLVQLEHRPVAGEAGQLLGQNLERALLLPLRAEIQGRVAPAHGKPEQRCEQRHRFVRAFDRLAEPALQLRERNLAIVAGRHAGRSLQLNDDRVERAVGMIGRALIEQADVGLASQPCDQLAHDPRLADPGLAPDQDHLAFAVPSLLPPAQQQRDLFLAPDQRRQGRAVVRLESTVGADSYLRPARR